MIARRELSAVGKELGRHAQGGCGWRATVVLDHDVEEPAVIILGGVDAGRF